MIGKWVAELVKGKSFVPHLYLYAIRAESGIVDKIQGEYATFYVYMYGNTLYSK